MRYFIESIIGRKGIRNISISDLKTGYIVRLRDDNYYVVKINDRLPEKSELRRATDSNMFIYIRLNEYDNRLNSKRDHKYDIVEVYQYKDQYRDEYIEFFENYDVSNKDQVFGRRALMIILSSGDYEKIFER